MSCPGMDERNWRLRQMLQGCGLVALVFSLVVGVLLLTGEHTGRLEGNLQSPLLRRVLAEGRGASADAEAREWAREMDRLARHSYFSGVRFRQRGMWLLAAGLLSSLAAFQGASRYGLRIPDPRRFGVPDMAATDGRTRRWLAAGAVVLLAATWLLPRAREIVGDAAPIVPSHAVPSLPATNSAAIAPTAASPLADAQLARGWTAFRGPWGLGVAFATNAPVTWDMDSGRGVRWKTPLSEPGFSSPIVWDGRVFVTTADARERAVLAFDLKSGVLVWRQVVPFAGVGTFLPDVSDDTGYAAPTMTTDGVRLFALFGTGDLAAFDMEGRRVWNLHLGAAAIDYGHASSPLYHDGRLLVQCDRSEEGFVRALDPLSGRTLWESARDVGPSWSSPASIPAPFGGRLLLLHAGHATMAHAFDDGSEAWRCDGVEGEIAPSPAWDAGRLYLAQDHSRLVAFSCDGSEPSLLWEHDDHLPDVASPVAAHGLVWTATTGGAAACLDGTDGKLLWEHNFDEGFHASPVVSGDRVYLVDRAGVVRIIAAGREFEQLASHKLGESCAATPAIGDGWIVFRTAGHLICVERIPD